MEKEKKYSYSKWRIGRGVNVMNTRMKGERKKWERKKGDEKGEMRMRIHWTIDSIKEKEKIIIKNKKNELNCVTLNIIDRTNGKLLPYVTVSRQKQIVKIFLHHLLWSVLYNKQYKTVREANILGQIPRWKEKKYQQKKIMTQ
jgi:hypothetical protein